MNLGRNRNALGLVARTVAGLADGLIESAPVVMCGVLVKPLCKLLGGRDMAQVRPRRRRKPAI